MAVKMLELTYKDSSMIAINALDKKIADFDNKTVIQIAHMSRNKYFIAHTICQKWLNKRWNGKLLIREVEWGPIKLPDWFKVSSEVIRIY